MLSDKGSPPKQVLFNQKLVFDEIKGDKNAPDSGDCAHDLGVYADTSREGNRSQELDQSYVQVCVEPFDEKTKGASAAAVNTSAEVSIAAALGEKAC